MAYSKTKRILLILLCVFVLFFPFWCVAGLCAETEEVELSNVQQLRLTANSNYFVTYSGASVTYFQAEPGYKYTITTSSSSDRLVVASSELPANNVLYDIIANILVSESNTYSFISTNNNYISLNGTNSLFTVTRENIGGMNDAVNTLASVVSPSAFWNIFDISINYIVIAVVVAFGIFIFTLVIKKITKGKEGF